MILQIILLILSIFSMVLLITFIFYVLQPSISEKVGISDNLLININEASQYFTEKKTSLKTTKNKAFVIHQNKIDIHSQAINFNSKFTCRMMKSLYFTDDAYKYVCLGFGDCKKICSQKAITIKNHLATVSASCCGCELCANICPQNIIKMIPASTKELPSGIFGNPASFEKDIEENQIDKNVEWKEKKGFKIWVICYRIFNKIKF